MKLSDFQGTGYRIVSIQDGQLVSLAGNDHINPTIGEVTTASGAGLFLGTSKAFVTDFYTGLTDFNDALLTYKYDRSDVLSGDPHSKDGEITVRKAVLVDIEEL